MRFAGLGLVLAIGLALTGAASGATGILAIGDLGSGGEVQRRLGAVVKRFEERSPAELLVTLGDNDYTASPQQFAANWRASYGWLPEAGVGVAGTLGNHDLEAGDGGRYEFALLGMPARYYTRRAGDVQLFLLDSNNVEDGQTAWLARVLAASTARWKIVALHHPPYSCGLHDGDGRVQGSWVPLFERHGVRLVLSGHEHSYQRFARRRGVTYVVHGGGHVRLYEPDACPRSYPRRLVVRKERGFLYLRADERSLRLFPIDATGRQVEQITIYP